MWPQVILARYYKTIYQLKFFPERSFQIIFILPRVIKIPKFGFDKNFIGPENPGGQDAFSE